MRILKKTYIYFFLATIIILFIVIIILFYKKSSYDGSIFCDIDSEINIERDKYGTPYVKAKTLNDAYFAIGFLHGQDRAALIEYFRAVADGKLAEVIGDEGSFFDRISLTIGFARNAESVSGKLKSPHAGYLNAYVNGINAARKNFQNDSSFKGRTSDWTARDVISILLLFEWADSFLNNMELAFPLPDKLNAGILKNIIPDRLLYQYSENERKSIRLLVKTGNELRKRIGQFQEGFAFYIRSEKMRDKKSVSGFTLDGDMNVYSKWYPVSLTVGSNRIDGITASGLPFVFFGRNEKMTFSGFNLNVDTQDFYLEKTRVINNTKQYYRNGVWQNFSITNERLFSNAKQKKENEKILSVMASDIGPVLCDLGKQGEDADCISINSLSPDHTYINTLFDIPTADSIIKAKRIVWNIHSLPKIYLFSTNEDAEYVYSGKISGRNTGRLFRDGTMFDGNYVADISGYSYKVFGDSIIIGNNIFENLPGILSDRIFDNDINRHNKFKELVGKKNHIHSEDIVPLLSNTHSATAEKFIPLFLPLLKHIPVPSAKLCELYFSNWDYNMNSESIAASIFNTLLIYMIEETIGDEMEKSTSVILEKYNFLIDNYYNLLAGNSPLFDDISTENLTETKENIFYRAFMKTLRHLNKEYGPKMENWKWGTVHKGRFIIPFRETKLFWKRGSLKDAGIPGDNSSVKKGEISAVNLLKPVNISLISAYFYLDHNLSFFNLSLSPTLDAQSEYYRNYGEVSDFVSFDTAGVKYRFIILPYKK